MEEQLEELQDKIAPVLERYGVARARLFGPSAKKRQEGRDVDILVQLQEDMSLLDLVALKLDLEHALGTTIHILEYPTIPSQEPAQDLPTLATRDTRQFVEDILASIVRIEEYTSGVTKDAFLEDTQVQDAVVRRLAIIGEAAKYMPRGFRLKYPNIRWSHLAAMTEVLVRGYFGIGLDRVWAAVKNDLPDLKAWLDAAFKDL
jgi:uncharacterized protein with HEPN domain/predicted nucleotidyltransferase